MFEQDDLNGFDAVQAAKDRLAREGRDLFPEGPDPQAASYWRAPMRPVMTAGEMAAAMEVTTVEALVDRLGAVWEERGDRALADLRPRLVEAVEAVAGSAGPEGKLIHTTYVMF